MERETREITTPSGKTAMLHTYLTAREAREIRLIYQKHVKVGMEPGAGDDSSIQYKPAIRDINMAAAEQEQEEATIKNVVKSYDQNGDNVLDRLLDAPSGDFEFVLAEAKKIVTNPAAPK